MATCIKEVAKKIIVESKGNKGVTNKETWWWNQEIQKIIAPKKIQRMAKEQEEAVKTYKGTKKKKKCKANF